VLRQLVAEERLLAFDLWTGSSAADGRVIVGDYEAEEAPLRLLAAAGVKLVRHLGVRSNSRASAGFESAVPLGRRRSGGVAEFRRSSGISYGPYGYPSPARVFVRAERERDLPELVLQFSIEKYSTMDVHVEPLDWKTIPVQEKSENWPMVAPSVCRFDIPRRCGYMGLALYLQPEMLVVADVTDLWTLTMGNSHLLYSAPSSRDTPSGDAGVLLLNCEALNWDVSTIVHGLDEGRNIARSLMSDLALVRADRARALPSWWDSADRYQPGRTALIRYSAKWTRPWISYANPAGAH